MKIESEDYLLILPSMPQNFQLSNSFHEELSHLVDFSRGVDDKQKLPFVILFTPVGRPDDEYPGTEKEILQDSRHRNRDKILITAFPPWKTGKRFYPKDPSCTFKAVLTVFVVADSFDIVASRQSLVELANILLTEYGLKPQSKVSSSLEQKEETGIVPLESKDYLHILPSMRTNHELSQAFHKELSTLVDFSKGIEDKQQLPLVIVFRPTGGPDQEFREIVEDFCHDRQHRKRDKILITAFPPLKKGQQFIPKVSSVRFKTILTIFVLAGSLDTEASLSSFVNLANVLSREYGLKLKSKLQAKQVKDEYDLEMLKDALTQMEDGDDMVQAVVEGSYGIRPGILPRILRATLEEFENRSSNKRFPDAVHVVSNNIKEKIENEFYLCRGSFNTIIGSTLKEFKKIKHSDR